MEADSALLGATTPYLVGYAGLTTGMLHLPPSSVQGLPMGKQSQSLNTLREIAFDHAISTHPDLATMARELGRVAHEHSSNLIKGLQPLNRRARGFERWLLGERQGRHPASVLIMAWPANHATPVHDHGGLWGLELALIGAIEVETYRRDPLSGELDVQGRDWLGSGDATWFDAGTDYLHRCRNLSRQETAISLHVYGGDLAEYLAYERAENDQRWQAAPRRSVLAGQLLA